MHATTAPSHDAMNADAAVAENLDQADKVQALNGTVHAATEAHGGPAHGEHGAEPMLGGVLSAGALVSIAMLVFIIILLVKKVPSLVTGALDSRIADIRKHLADAARLRAEAEALRGEYEKKLAAAEKEAADMRARAEEDATHIVAEAKTDAANLIKRRQKMAEDKIAAAERAAVNEIRAKTVAAATAAAGALIASGHDANADKAFVDTAINGL